MEDKKILIVDDEKNIRLTLSQSIEDTGAEIDTAVNGEEGLKKAEENDYDIILLDIKMPGIDGIEVLRRLREKSTKATVVIITAHGTIDNAVEAMKLGAVDFIQKPFSPNEIRDLIRRINKREDLGVESTESYDGLIELGKKAITDKEFDKARNYISQAIAKDATKAEAYNLLGVIFEMYDKKQEARKQYLAATNIDPTYKPAQRNLQRVTSWSSSGKMEY